LISEDVPNKAGQVHAEQGGLAAVAVLPRSREHGDGDQQTGGVGDDEPLASVDVLAGVVAARGLPTVSAPLTLWESRTPADGSGSRPCAMRALTRSAEQ
jgi:hypothetical protein